jgi:hypothetical protein
MVVMENFEVRNMSRSAAGTVEQPGRNVKQKTGLNKSILDQKWGDFRRQMKYKMIWTGGLFVPVPPQNTSTACPALLVLDVDLSPRRTARSKRSLLVSSAASRRMSTLSGSSTSPESTGLVKSLTTASGCGFR